MQYIIYALCGAVAGVLGGMGMGGGTLLIPLLTILLGFNQKVAQSINLISFSVMAIIVIIFHIKNKLIDIKIAISFALVALITSIMGAFLANQIEVSVLKILFGVLLIVIAIYEAVQEICLIYRKKNK